MAKSSSFPTLGIVSLDRASPVSLHRQLYDCLREAILTRQLAAGMQLPPSRMLAADLAVSRNTVLNAYEQLIAEGYLASKTGAGTYVSHDLPDEVLQVRTTPVSSNRPALEPEIASNPLSKRGSIIAATSVSPLPDEGRPRPFRAGLPALDAFPVKLWSRLVARRWRNLSCDMLAYGQAAGYRPLREAIAAYLGAARGVRCEPAQVIVVAGAQQAIDLAARVLLNRGDAVWIEDPGYLGARGALLAAGARLVPVPVDAQGFDVQAGLAACPEARLVYISPSHQYPLGLTMSLARRLALLQWAGQAKAWVLEDDYDSEYRYVGHPLAALQGLDTMGRVIYIGTFSKVLYPALRLGYLVAPPDLVDAFVAARALTDRGSPWLEQAVLADFMTEGHFARHIRRMRALYAERQAALVDMARERLAGPLEINSAEAGLHLVGWLPEGVDDRAISQQLALHQVETVPLSAYVLASPRRGGLVLGYAALDIKAIQAGVRQMETVFSRMKGSRG